MKRQVCFFLAALLLTMGIIALAEQGAPITRREVIQLEGMDETITTAYYQSPLGYSIWIDSEILQLLPGTEYPCDEFGFPANSSGDFRVAIQYVIPISR